MTNNLPNFWSWFFSGVGASPGYRRVFDRWLLVHILIGLCGATLIGKDLPVVAGAALLPLMAIFVGLTFSWAGNAHSLLQSSEIVQFAQARSGGVAEYIFTFQLSILIILVSVVGWVMPLLGLPFVLDGFFQLSDVNFVAGWVLYSLLSLSFRSSWHAVLGANMLLLIRAKRLAQPVVPRQLGNDVARNNAKRLGRK